MYQGIALQVQTVRDTHVSKNGFVIDADTDKDRKKGYIQCLILKLTLDYHRQVDQTNKDDDDDERVVYTYPDDNEEDTDEEDDPNNKVQPNDKTQSTVGSHIEFASNMFYDFVNYVTSFVQNVPGEQVIEPWFNHFHNRINENRNC